MNITKRETILHYTMSFIGGIFAIYSLLEHSNVFGSAETSNMILLVENLLHWDAYHILIRIGSLLVYAFGIVFTLFMAKYHSEIQKIICLVIDCVAALVLGFLPVDTHPVVALYPMAFAMSIQWCTFRGVSDNPSATTFSTGNFRQLVTNIFNYVTDKNREYIRRIKFYVLTMVAFHTGVAVIYLAWPYSPHHSIWIVFIPLVCAFVQEASIYASKKEKYKAPEDNGGCEDV